MDFYKALPFVLSLGMVSCAIASPEWEKKCAYVTFATGILCCLETESLRAVGVAYQRCKICLCCYAKKRRKRKTMKLPPNLSKRDT